MPSENIENLIFLNENFSVRFDCILVFHKYTNAH